MKSTVTKFTKYSTICQWNIENFLLKATFAFLDKIRLEYPNIKGLFQFLFCIYV
jgi:hypothetical protein